MIAARLRGVTDDGEELPELIPKIQAAFDKLDYSKLGIAPIQVKDANGELKSTYDILSDLQKVWGDINTTERAFISEAVAGNRQNVVLTSIMEGWADVSLAIQNSENATGSAMSENEKYKQSVEGIQNQISSLSQQLSNNFFSADQYKPILSFFKELLSILTSITGNKAIMTLLTGAGAWVGLKTLSAILKTFNTTKLGINLKSSFDGIGNFLKGIPQLLDIFKSARAAGFGFSDSMKLTALSLNDVGIAASTAQIALGALFAVFTIGMTVINGIKQANEEARQRAREAASAFSEEKQAIDDQIASVEELRNALSSGELSLQEEYNTRKQLLELQKQITEQYGDQVDGIDLVNGRLDEELDKLKAITKEQAHQLLYGSESDQVEKSVSEMEKDRTYTVRYMEGTTVSEIEAIQKAIAEIGDNRLLLDEDSRLIEFTGNAEDASIALEALMLELNEIDSSEFSTIFSGIIDDIGSQLNSAQKTLDQYYEQYTQAIQAKIIDSDVGLAINGEQTKKTYNDLYVGLLESNSAYNEAIAKNDEDAIARAVGQVNAALALIENAEISDEGIREYFDTLVKESQNAISKVNFEIDFKVNDYENNRIRDQVEYIRDTFLDGMDDLDIEAIPEIGTEEQRQGYSLLTELADEYGMSIKSLIDLLVELGVVQGEVAESPLPNIDMKTVADNFSEDIASLYSQFDILNTALEEWNAMGAISAGTFSSIIESGLAEYIQFTSDGLVINSQALLDNEIRTKEKAKADLQEAMMVELKALALQSAEQAEVGAGNAATVAGQQAAVAGENAKSGASGWISYAAAVAAAGGSGAFKGVEAEARRIYDTFTGLWNSIDNVTYSTNSASNAFGGYQNAAKGAAGANKELTDSIKKQKESLEDQEDAINDLLEMTIKMIKKEKQLQKEALQDELDGYKKIIDARKELLHIREEEYNYQKELAEANKEVSEIESELLAIQFDDSEAAQRKRLELQEQLTGATNDLNELQHDREVELSEDALDTEYERFEELQKAKIEAIDRYLDMEGQIRQDAIALIEARTQEFYNRLLEWNRFSYRPFVQKCA